MKSTIGFVLFLGTLFVIHSAVHSQSGWFTLNSGTNQQINDIQFLDANTGYYIYRYHIPPPYTSYVRKSIDGGISWITTMTISEPLNRIYFIDVNTGIVVGALGIIRKTTNGGTTWITQTSPAGSNALVGVKFINENTGFIAGGYRTILFTTDGGTTWINRPFGPTDVLWRDIYFFNGNTGVVVGSSPTGQSIIRTTDAGFSWYPASGTVAGEFYRTSFADNFTGFCAGISNGNIVKSTDRGNNWFTSNNATNYACYGISVIDINNITAVGGGGTFGGNGKIVRTTNGGLNWILQPISTTKRLWGVSFINSNTGWACGDTGTLLKTTTGGFTAIEPISNEIPNEFKLYQNYPNPFNPISKIKYQITKLSFTKLVVYDILGSEVTALVNEQLKPGTYEIEFDGTNYPSGVYFYKLFAAGYTETKRMVLMK